MADIGHEHLHHMAKRLHHTNQKLDAIRAKFSGALGKAVDTVSVGAGAWLGGAIEGKTGGDTFMRVPYNLGIGAVLLLVGHVPSISGEYSKLLNNLGNGFVGSYVAAVGYQFGKRWKDTGKLFGGHSWSNPYELPGGAAETKGELSEAQMASIVQRMQQAAASAHP
jgi:hypothetical protein